jgi:hypothetical protein
MQISIEGLLSREYQNERFTAFERFFGIHLPFRRHRAPRPQWVDFPPIMA